MAAATCSRPGSSPVDSRAGALASSKGLQPTITAGVLIFRGFTYLLPIIVGAFCYLGWRMDKGRGVPVTADPELVSDH